MNAWYLLYCKPNSEKRAQQNLSLQNVQTYLPQLYCKKVSRGKEKLEQVPLFPNYLFAKFDPAVTSVSSIRSTRGVAFVVDSREQMTPLCHLVFALRRFEKRQEQQLQTPEQTGVADTPPVVEPEFQPGEPVGFKEGPFMALEGVYQQSNGNQRCQVLLELLGKIQSVKVPTSQLQGINKD